jgi:hypothetical protein
MEGKIRSKEGQDPPCDEYRRQEEIVGFDESALGCEEETRLVDFWRPTIGISFQKIQN